MRPRGFYWVRLLLRDATTFNTTSRTVPEIMLFSDGAWYTAGSDDYYTGDEDIEVLAGPLEPPT